MKDVLDREINIGDIVAFGSPNKGRVDVRIVAGLKENEVLVRGCSKIKREYDSDKHEWVDVEPYLEMERGGWTFASRVVVINESVPDDLKKFLREGIK